MSPAAEPHATCVRGGGELPGGLRDDGPVKPLRMLFVGSGSAEIEAFGFRLAASVAWALRDLEVPPGAVPEGPHFRYEQGPDLFLGRRGRGPLHVVWDTNLLIDYFEHGRALWDVDSEWLSHVVPGTRGEELEALQLSIALWVVRDIRFHLLPRTLDDARRSLSPQRQTARRRAFEEFTATLAHTGDDTRHPIEAGRLILPPGELDRALRDVPAGGDRALVGDAVRLGAHVFLTTDKGILRCRDKFRAFGLVLATPGDLLEALAATGALHCLIEPSHLYWPAPDQERVWHLIRALPPAARGGEQPQA